MKTSIKYPTDTTVKVTINLDKDDLSDAKQVALVKIAKNLKVPGFRKGKVPINVALKNADPMMVAEETVDAAISKAVSKAFLDNNIQALDTPQVEMKKYVPEESLECTAEVEIIPKIELGEYKKLKAKKDKQSVEDSEIETVIERMLHGMSEKTAVERAAKQGDEAIIDFIGKKDGVAFDGGTGTDYPLTLGSNSFIPGFEEGIIGKKTGETFDLELKFPDDYHVANLKGQPVVFTTTLKSINEHKHPELTDEFAAKVGPFTSVKELKDDIKRELQAQKDRDLLEKFKDDLLTELISISKVPVPEILISDQSKSIEQDFQSNLMYQGLTIDQYLETQKFKDKEEWINKEVKPAAVKRVQAGLILAELSKVEKIQATADELAENINRYREQYASRPEIVKQFETVEAQRDLANRLITEKTIDRLVELNYKK
jgi:trigger factor